MDGSHIDGFKCSPLGMRDGLSPCGCGCHHGKTTVWEVVTK